MSGCTDTLPFAARPLSLDEALASARETRALLVGRDNLEQAPEMFRAQFRGARAAIVADTRTFAAAGERTRDAFSAAGLDGPEPFVFDDADLHAEHRFVDRLTAAFQEHNAIPVAVGAGTINDLVKLAAHRSGRSYLCVATAASMDGYTAFGASITHEGAKQTFDCPAPAAVVADTGIICQAPPEMSAAGYADLQAKITAGADWIIADALGAEPIDARAWEIVQGGLRAALADPAGVRAGREAAVRPLVEGLMLGGFAMQWSKSSRPASGAEHQFSHLWDMEHHVHHGIAPSHGFKVGIATLAVTALYEHLLEQPLERLDVAHCVARWPDHANTEAGVLKLFSGSGFVETALRETRAKHVSRPELQLQLERLREVWPALRERLRAQLLPYTELKHRLRSVGAPVEPEAIGLSRRRLRESFRRACHIRRRFTVLDLALRAGLLEESLDALFGAGGPWKI